MGMIKMRDCPDCRNEKEFCRLHQKAEIEYEKLKNGDVDKRRDPIFLVLLKKYGENWGVKMGLSDIFSNMIELEVFDFLAENNDKAFKMKELSESLNHSVAEINDALSKMYCSYIVEIAYLVKGIQYFELRENEIVENLMKTVLSHSFLKEKYE